MIINNIFEIKSGHLKSRLDTDENATETVVYNKQLFECDRHYGIDYGDIEVDHILLNKEKYFTINEGDIIVDTLTSKAAIVSQHTQGMFIAFNYVLLRPKIEIDKDYFVAWFNLSDHATVQLTSMLQGTVIKKLSLKLLKEMEISLPNLNEQRMIGDLYKSSLKKLSLSKKLHLNECDMIRNIMEAF